MPNGIAAPGNTTTPPTGILGRYQGPPTRRGNPPTNQGLWDFYQGVTGKSIEDYQDILGQFKGFNQGQLTAPGEFTTSGITADDIQAANISLPNFMAPGIRATGISGGAPSEALSRFRDFSETGGFSPDDIRNIRARGVSPIRSVYAQAQQNIDRQRALQGEYSPNYTAATAKLSRELAGQLSGASTNVEAMLAPLIQRGKLAGLQGFRQAEESGLSRAFQSQLANQQANLQTSLANQRTGQSAQQDRIRIALANQQAQTGATSANQQARMQAQLSNQRANLQIQQMNDQARAAYNQQIQAQGQSRLQAIQGQASLYGTQPGQAQVFGDQVQRAIGQGIDFYRAQGGEAGPYGSQATSRGGGVSIGAGTGSSNSRYVPRTTPRGPTYGNVSSSGSVFTERR